MRSKVASEIVLTLLLISTLVYTYPIFALEPTVYALTVGAVGSGTTVPAPGVHTYYEGTCVDVTAIPDAGWKLNHWKLDGANVGTANPYTVTMNSDHTLIANFTEIPAPPEYTLTIGAVGPGTTSPSPGSYLFDEGDIAYIQAISSDPSGALDHWELDGVADFPYPTYMVFMDTDHTIIAFFGSPPRISITRARMVSPSVLGIDATVSFPNDDPDEGPRYVKLSATINGQFVREQIDVTERVGPGETVQIEWVHAHLLEIDLKKAHDEENNLVEIPRFTMNEQFCLEAVAWSPACGRSEVSEKQVQILLPTIILHGITLSWYEPLLASIPLRIYESLIDRLTAENYTTDPSWYKTLWYQRYNTKWSPDQVEDWLDNLVDEAVDATYADRVNIIGHSLGGLIGRYYTQNHANKVHKLITVGTPHEGSSWFYIKAFELQRKQIDKYPLGRWLVPTYQALYYPNGTELEPVISNSFPHEPIPEDVACFSIYNWKIQDTPYQLVVEPYRDWYKVVNVINQVPGDGTVPAFSAHLDGANNRPLEVAEKHAFLPKSSSVQDEISECLTDAATN